MEKLPKLNKNGYPVERFFKIVRTLPPCQCHTLGELLQEFGKWLVYDSHLSSTKVERTAGTIAERYKDADRVARLICDKGYAIEDAIKVVLDKSVCFNSVEQLENYALSRIKSYHATKTEQRNRDIAIRLLQGETLLSIAEEHGISTSQVHRIGNKW